MVEWKKLGEITEIGTGSNNREDACDNGCYPFYVRSQEVLKIDSGPHRARHDVTILDTFEASIQNLEAQLSQREKQYEYYRNKLLTFE